MAAFSKPEENVVAGLHKNVRLLAALASLVACGAAHADTWVLSGTIVTPTSAIDSASVVVTDRMISAVGAAVSPPPGARQIPVNGIILPGFINLHDHLTWNVLPRWSPARKFSNRYEWQDFPDYDRNMRTPQGKMMTDGLACEADLFAEVKALVGGATSVVGSDSRSGKCTLGLARNLDLTPDFPPYPPGAQLCRGDSSTFPPGAPNVVAYEIFPLELPNDRFTYYQCEIANGRLRSLIIHLSEGASTDSSAHREFRMLKQRKLLSPNVLIIHGSALAYADFLDMASNGMGLIWSPRSNEELYGTTTNIPAAIDANVGIALAPDWSPTGSAGMLQELNFINTNFTYFGADQLVKMATSIPAKLARLDDRIGTIAPGMYADLVVLGRRPNTATPYGSIAISTPADVQLVMVGGTPMYGDYGLMQQIAPSPDLYPLTICGAQKAINLQGFSEAWPTIIETLSAELERYGIEPAPFECD